MSTTRRPEAKKRPQTMADVISLAPSASIEYVLFNGLGQAVSAEEISNRIVVLEQDKRLHSPVYRRIVIAYLLKELERRSREVGHQMDEDYADRQ